MNRLDGLALT